MKPLDRITTGTAVTHPIKVLQFGGGNFLRGFADWIIDCMNEKANFDGSVQIVLSVNKEMGRTLDNQQGLYHLITNGLVNGKPFREIRLITAVSGAIDPVDNYKAFLQAAENTELQFIISNTTEAGIEFDAKDRNPIDVPSTFPGKLTAFLFHRFQHLGDKQQKKLIVLPCELIQANGERLRDVILQYSKHWNLSATFRDWISANIIFCNTLVDRIVPGFPKEKHQEISQEIGYDDKLMITAEPFHFWAIQPCTVKETDIDYVRKSFPAEKASLQVKFVNDLTPYHTRKVRILNGAHTVLTPVAYLSGQRFVKESVDDAILGNFIRHAIFSEILPTLDMDKQELKQFAEDVLERFQNPFIKHELKSIALNSISKFNVRVLPSIRSYYEINNRLPEHLMFSWAALICFYKGEWRGEPIALNDNVDVLHFFKDIWLLNDLDEIARKVLSNKTFWSDDLSIIPGIIETLSSDLKKITSAEHSGSEALFPVPGKGMFLNCL